MKSKAMTKSSKPSVTGPCLLLTQKYQPLSPSTRQFQVHLPSHSALDKLISSRALCVYYFSARNVFFPQIFRSHALYFHSCFYSVDIYLNSQDHPNILWNLFFCFIFHIALTILWDHVAYLFIFLLKDKCFIEFCFQSDFNINQPIFIF